MKVSAALFLLVVLLRLHRIGSQIISKSQVPFYFTTRRLKAVKLERPSPGRLVEGAISPAWNYPNAPRHFRLYATEPLEYIHSDLAVEKCLQLLRQENEVDVRVNLAHALLSHFAPEGIEETRKLLVGRQLDFESRGLRNYLVETCTIMGERFPEYDEWRAAERTEKEEHWERIKELEGDPAGLMLFALEKLTGKKTEMPETSKAKTSVQPMSRQVLAPKSESKQRVGRNDPCPCGSGKKFKQCCLRTGNG